MSYNIRLDGKLVAVTKDCMDAVMKCNDLAKTYDADTIVSTYVNLDGTEQPHDWLKDYSELCYGRFAT